MNCTSCNGSPQLVDFVMFKLAVSSEDPGFILRPFFWKALFIMKTLGKPTMVGLYYLAHFKRPVLQNRFSV